MTAIDVREVSVPAVVKKPGASNHHAFELTTMNGTIGVIYAHEPHGDEGEVLVHVSVSKSSGRMAASLSVEDIAEVARVIRANKLKWPKLYDVTKFQAGPFRGCGLHIWETLTPSPKPA